MDMIGLEGSPSRTFHASLVGCDRDKLRQPGHGWDVNQVHDAPAAIALLEVSERERSHFGTPQAAAQEYGQDSAVAQSP